MEEKPVVKNFKATRLNDIKVGSGFYSDGFDIPNRNDREKGYEASDYGSFSEVLEALDTADSNKDELVKLSEKLYATNRIYQALINNYVNAFLWRYVVVPQKLKVEKQLAADQYHKMYSEMVELADGLNLEVKMPQILQDLYVDGCAYITSYYDKEHNAINLMLLPWKFCRKIGETILGTKVIMFNYAYFDSLGLSADQIKTLLKTSFTEEMSKGYNAYKSDSKKKWQILDPKHSSAVMCNSKGIPTFLYVYGGILNYQTYAINELDKSNNQIENILVHKLPTYQDKLLFEVPEMQALHQKISAITKSASHTRLVTTIGDITVHPLQEQDSRENEVLSKAYKSIYEMTGLNGELFNGSNAEALKEQEKILRGEVWGKVEEIVNLLNVILNNWSDFKNGYQADLTMLSISRDNVQEDTARYQAAAGFGIGVTNFIVASGVKQKNIESYLDMEENLGYVARLKPLLSTNTATAKDSETSATETQSSKTDNADDTGTGDTATDEQTADDNGDGVSSKKSKESSDVEQK